MALNVPYANDVPIMSLSDAVGKWTQINNQQAAAGLAQQQEARLQNQNERENKIGDLKYNLTQHSALKEVMTDYKSALQRQAQQMGVEQGTPEYQKLANALYSNNYDKIVQNISGKAHDPNTDIDLNAVESLAGMTPSEQAAAELQSKKAELDLAQPYKLEVAQAQAGINQARQDRQIENQWDMKFYDTEQQSLREQRKRQWDLEDASQKQALKDSKPVKVPSQIVKAYMENKSAIRKIDDALTKVGTNPDALGLGNLVGDTITQRTDPEGVSTRAIIADIGSLKIHDRSGAAVTAAEAPRLKPFIPNVTDTPDTVIKKLEQFKTEYEAINNDFNAMYGDRLNGTQNKKSIPTKPDNVDPVEWEEYLRDEGYI